MKKKYFGCWEYRENQNSDYKIIMTVGNEKNMFRFPYENQFGYRDKNNEFTLFDNSTVTDMFGVYSTTKDIFGDDFVGFSCIYGGKIIGEIPSYWKGDNIKSLTKNLNEFPKSKKVYINCLVNDRTGERINPDKLYRLRFNLEKYCQITES